MDHTFDTTVTNRIGPYVTIGAAARRFGLAESTLRYWERRGLLRPAARRSRWRQYGPDELHRIGLIQMWRETGLMSLDEIAHILTDHSHNWRSAVVERVRAIESQQDRLVLARKHLEHLLLCPDENPAENCPYLREMTTNTESTA
ncbi:MerR family transcriptional regulator [Nocardia wallacei]|uniref:MerR family transcriptional regulator n=1 Tax=Nocardia wallacei TaxID=480035 RepID=UPI002454F855|nr:MerR family transcriptional regulator [Nocardia wallacei]